MTSINAIRFDAFSGAMICDEQRHWNPEKLKVYAADKIRPVIPESLTNRYRFVAAYGNTGTSTIGDEMRLTIKRRVQADYDRLVETTGEPPTEFMSMENLARMVFELMVEIKHRHINEELRHYYGFDTAEFCAGRLTRNGKESKIANSQVLADAHDKIALDPSRGTQNAVFNNAGILAGFHPRSGFRIFLFSMREHFFEPVESGFVSQGSGGDSTNFVLPRLFNTLKDDQREGHLDRLEGLMLSIEAINTASQVNLGVGGYFNLLLFDGRAEPKTMLREINDHRIKLSCEVVAAVGNQLLERATAKQILDKIIYGDGNLDEAETILFERCLDRERLHRLLRGYPLGAA